MEEKWRAVVGNPTYEISSEGRLRRAPRGVKPRKNRSGYLQATLSVGSRKITKTLHRMVAEAFLGRSDGLQVNHKNGDKSDNRLSNLEWVSGSENVRRALRTGLSKYQTPPVYFGESHPQSRLSLDDVRAIRSAATVPSRKLAKRFGVSKTSILSIRHRRTWKEAA